MRRTKIVATIGPASESSEMLDAMIASGVDVVRMNFSHGTHDEHRERVRRVREIARRLGRNVGVVGDLQGPKIRIERFAGGEVTLEEGAAFVLDAALAGDAGDAGRVGVSYRELPRDVDAGDVLLVDDGRLELIVESVAGDEIRTRVEVGGPLSDNKGINRQGGGLSAPAITDKDRADIELAAELDVDYLAVSFPRTAQDIETARRLFEQAGGHGGIVAKIERAEAVAASHDILEVADAIMVARGDLGVEIGDAELPAVQKQLIRDAEAANVPVITATQMMESMVTQPLPTRAEVFDVANAVLDGTDAVMLSAETATGAYPAEAIQAMGRICIGAERHRSVQVSEHRIDSRFERTDEAIAMAAMYTANHLGVRAIASLTESGSTSLWMSRIHSGIPIYALTRHERTARRVSLYRGVYPVSYPIVDVDAAAANRTAVEVLVERGVVGAGDRVIITKGDLMGVHGGTNSMKIVEIGADGQIDVAPESE
ncbi:MAG: pyruvate kinase [Halofilum sp. (in: g-proteobacteria)]|nr:pyruvate kinase [Halofilum sp. (in: g-proteobacteria)]